VITLNVIKDTTIMLKEHFGGSINIRLEVWNYSHREEPNYSWAVWVSVKNNTFNFTSWAELSAWMSHQMSPVDDEVAIEDGVFPISDEKLQEWADVVD